MVVVVMATTAASWSGVEEGKNTVQHTLFTMTRSTARDPTSVRCSGGKVKLQHLQDGGCLFCGAAGKAFLFLTQRSRRCSLSCYVGWKRRVQSKASVSVDCVVVCIFVCGFRDEEDESAFESQTDLSKFQTIGC